MRWLATLSLVCLFLSPAAIVCAQQEQEGQPREGKPQEPRPHGTKPQETKPQETKPQEAKPQETPPAATPAPTRFDRLQIACDRYDTSLKDQLRCIGNAELPIDDQTKIFADQIDLFFSDKHLVAVGNVVFAGTEGRITAERVEYKVESNVGTFTDAFGIMSLGAKADRRQFGNQDADVYFFGQTIEKQGPRKYRITRGGFSTCVQPTPRWEMTSRSLTLNLDDYAFARDTVLRVKGVPIMYLPVVYYPIQDSGRATGFLLPTYGASTVKGHGISNAFFWAIGRSQDATFMHDWYSRAGQQEGAEYRYVLSPQSSGDVRFSRFDQSEASYTDNGVTTTIPSGTSYQVSANASQAIARGLRARARVDYFTDLRTQQLYHQNIYQATQPRTYIEAGLTGNLGPLATSALYQRSELFSDAETSSVYGSTPQITASLSPLRLFSAPIYASVNSQYAYLPSEVISSGVVTSDTSFGLLDVTPTIRVPLSRLTFLSVNTSATYRTTRYSRTFDSQTQTYSNEPFMRQYSSLRSDIIGPVFTRIWDLKSGFAERLKHVIEPAYTVDFTSHISDYTSTPRNGGDTSDFVVSGNTKVTYGLTNRFFYRARTVNDVRGQTREFITVGIQQTRYTNPEAAKYDSAYQTAWQNGPTDVSPILLTTRVSPTNLLDANAKFEYDATSGQGLEWASIGGTLNLSAASANVNYNRFNTSQNKSDWVSGGTTLHWLDGRANLSYSLSFDIAQSRFQQQSVMMSYLAQCCGLQIEFQKFSFAQGIPVSSDRRFNIGFVLAGLGTFSNFFGAFGGGGF